MGIEIDEVVDEYPKMRITVLAGSYDEAMSTEAKLLAIRKAGEKGLGKAGIDPVSAAFSVLKEDPTKVMGQDVQMKKEDGTSLFIEGDTVVLAKEMEANEKLVAELSGKGAKVFAVGDGANPAKIMEAQASGLTLGYEL